MESHVNFYDLGVVGKHVLSSFLSHWSFLLLYSMRQLTLFTAHMG